MQRRIKALSNLSKRFYMEQLDLMQKSESFASSYETFLPRFGRPSNFLQCISIPISNI